MRFMTLVLALAVIGLVPGGAAAQQPRLVIVAGLGGAPEYRDRFLGWAVDLYDAARQAGLSDADIVLLAEDASRDSRIDGRSTSDELARALTALAADAGPADPVTLVYLGHGSVRDGTPRLNLPGPDVGPAELAPLLDALAPRPVAFVNTAPSSGGFIEPLAGPERTLIAATKTTGERNETFFGGFFVQAFAGDDADADKDERVSLLEAFDYARREVARRYQREGLILTEHAVLDDDGDGAAVETPAATGAGDGARARRTWLGPSRAAVAASAADDPALRALYARKDSIQRAIDELRGRKPAMEPAAYDDALEALLLELAGVNADIERRGGGA